MSHFLNRSTVKSPVADAAAAARTPRDSLVERGISEKHVGTTRIPRSRVLKPPIG